MKNLKIRVQSSTIAETGDLDSLEKWGVNLKFNLKFSVSSHSPSCLLKYSGVAVPVVKRWLKTILIEFYVFTYVLLVYKLSQGACQRHKTWQPNKYYQKFTEETVARKKKTLLRGNKPWAGTLIRTKQQPWRSSRKNIFLQFLHWPLGAACKTEQNLPR